MLNKVIFIKLDKIINYKFTELVKQKMGQCIGRGSDDPFNDIHPHIFSVLNIDENGR